MKWRVVKSMIKNPWRRLGRKTLSKTSSNLCHLSALKTPRWLLPGMINPGSNHFIPPTYILVANFYILLRNAFYKQTGSRRYSRKAVPEDASSPHGNGIQFNYRWYREGRNCHVRRLENFQGQRIGKYFCLMDCRERRVDLCLRPPDEKSFTCSVQNVKITCAVSEYHGVSKKGHAPYNPRKKNQDSLIMKEEPMTNSLILCTLDGHGEHGDHVSAWFRDRLVKEMSGHPSWVNDMKLAIAESIAKVEKDLLKNYRIDAEFSGTTLTMAIIRDNHLTGINIGDSRVILGTEKDGRLVPVEVTIDHKPDSPKEKERILATGGRVFAVEYDDGIDGPPRVWLGHMDVPGLAMSR